MRLRLVGGQRIFANEGDDEARNRFYADLFARMPREVKHTRDLSRYVGFHGYVGHGNLLHFLGIEVGEFGKIPKGMVAWELTGETWALRADRDGQDSTVSQVPIHWRWLHDGDGRPTGDFCADGIPEPNGKASEGMVVFQLCANAYVEPQASSADADEIRLVDYDPDWPRQFDEFAGWLKGQLGRDLALCVEHYGSTAIPGIPAKPVIDVLVEIPSFPEAQQRVIPLLNCPEWEYWWYSEHMVFVKRDRLMGRRTHHVHLATRGHKLWEGLAFRDYLRCHPDEAARYAELKRHLAESHRHDRERYTQAKSEYVRRVTSAALQWRNEHPPTREPHKAGIDPRDRVSFRRAMETDAGALAKIQVESWRGAYGGLIRPVVLVSLSVEMNEAEFVRALREQSQETYVASLQDEIVGFATIGPSRDGDAEPNTAEIREIDLSPHYWRRGIGTQMVEWCLETLRPRGADQVVLWVYTRNEAAKRFYESVGFRPDGAVRTIEYKWGNVPEMRYRLVFD